MLALTIGMVACGDNGNQGKTNQGGDTQGGDNSRTTNRHWLINIEICKESD